MPEAIGAGGRGEPGQQKRQRKTFRMLPDALFTHPETQPQDLMTWCYLGLHARNRGFCHVTDRQLAEDMGVVQMTVRRSLARLDKMGFIIRERNANERTIVLCPDGKEDAPGMTLKLLNAC